MTTRRHLRRRGAPALAALACVATIAVVPVDARAEDPIGPVPITDSADVAAEPIGASAPNPATTTQSRSADPSVASVDPGATDATPIESTAVGRFIVRFRDGIDTSARASTESEIETAGFSIVDRYDAVFPGVVVDGPESQREALASIDGVETVSADRIIELEDASVLSTQNGAPWNLDRIDQRGLPLSSTYNYRASGKGVTAYILDTGLRRTHTEFGGRALPGAFAQSVGPGSGDCNGHGTHVAGTLGGSTYGIAKEVTVVPVKVFTCGGIAVESDLLAGLNWIINEHVSGPAVLNMSLGGAASKDFDAAVRNVIDDGITVVAAAGNSAVDACLDSPARVDAAITVGATNAGDAAASFTNYGPCLDLFAPGVDITSTWNTSDSATWTMSGTSMAAPLVTGAAALLLSQEPTLTPAIVAARLIADSTPGLVTGAGPGSPNRLLHVQPEPSTTLTALTPTRILETRSGPGLGTIDGAASGLGPALPNSTTTLQVAGRGGVPTTGVSAVVLNISVTDPTAASFVTAHPTGSPRPNAANLTFSAGQTISNLAIVPLGTGGRVDLYNLAGSTELVVDVLGWFPVGPNFSALSPTRILETRSGPGLGTIDGLANAGGPVGPDSTTALQVAGRGGVPGGGVAASVVVNISVTEPTAGSFLTAHPTGSARPNAANLTFSAGQTISNLAIVPVGPDGRINLYNLAGSTHLVVDVLGWFPTAAGSAGPNFSGLSPARILETRSGPGLGTVDGAASGSGTVAANSTTTLLVTSRAGVPAYGVGAVVVNVSVADPSAPSFLTAHPTGGPRPNAANLTFPAAQTISNLAIVPVGSGGQINLYNLAGNTQMIVDVLGWFPIS